MREELEARISGLEDENENLTNENTRLLASKEWPTKENAELLREKDNLVKANAELKTENDKLKKLESAQKNLANSNNQLLQEKKQRWRKKWRA
ncbi:hypothetical protein HpBT193_02420 [Helicobacter pylori]